ncbi:MAG: phosphohistidine phosphatase SixA [Acidobacteriota bacterium]
MQHGEALPERIDPERPLSDKGRADVQRIAAVLRRAAVRVHTIEHSGKKRAAQTAELLATALGVQQIGIRSGIGPKDAVAPFVSDVTCRPDDLMVVGHLPFLGKAAAALVNGDESKPVVSFQQGGVVCLCREADGVWTIAWMLLPALFVD